MEKICDAIFLHVLKKPGLFSNERFLVMTSASSRSLISSKKSSDFPASKSGDGYTHYYSMGYLWNMLTALQTRLRTFVVFASKVWTFICFIFRRQTRSLIQHKAIKYNVYPLSPLSKHRLSIVRRKTLVLDLDETLIHSFHDGVLRPTVRPGTPPDFILKVTIDRHPVRFFVHKRPHVDFFPTNRIPMVRACRVHSLNGDLRNCRCGQVGQRSGAVASKILQAALHPRLWILHKGPQCHLC